MSQPLHYTPQILAVMDDVSRKTQQLVTLAEEIQRMGTQVEASSEGQMITALVQKVTAWMRDMGEHTATNAAFVRGGTDSYEQMVSVDRQGANLFG